MILISLACFLITTGCRAIIAGTATGAGVYTYQKGEVLRSCPEAYTKTVGICLDALKELKLAINIKQSNGIKTRIDAKQTDDTPMTVKVSNIAPQITEVSVRTGVFGVWDKKVSELIHATIAKRIQL
jgi:hypothetical protein